MTPKRDRDRGCSSRIRRVRRPRRQCTRIRPTGSSIRSAQATGACRAWAGPRRRAGSRWPRSSRTCSPACSTRSHLRSNGLGWSGKRADLASLRERDQVRSALLSSIGRDLEPASRGDLRCVARAAADPEQTKQAASAIASEAIKLDRYRLQPAGARAGFRPAPDRGEGRHYRPGPAAGFAGTARTFT